MPTGSRHPLPTLSFPANSGSNPRPDGEQSTPTCRYSVKKDPSSVFSSCLWGWGGRRLQHQKTLRIQKGREIRKLSIPKYNGLNRSILGLLEARPVQPKAGLIQSHLAKEKKKNPRKNQITHSPAPQEMKPEAIPKNPRNSEQPTRRGHRLKEKIAGYLGNPLFPEIYAPHPPRLSPPGWLQSFSSSHCSRPVLRVFYDHAIF